MHSQNVTVSHTLNSPGPQYKGVILSTAVVEIAHKNGHLLLVGLSQIRAHLLT